MPAASSWESKMVGRDGKIQRVYRGYAESALPAIVADLNKAIGATPQP